jgi:hypothetical protein
MKGVTEGYGGSGAFSQAGRLRCAPAHAHELPALLSFNYPFFWRD